jgi:hypothetical protein
MLFPRLLRVDRGLMMRCCVAATVSLAVACGGDVLSNGSEAKPPASFKREDITSVTQRGADLIVDYRTRTSLRDCKPQTAEMTQVWDLVVRERLSDAALTRVILSPEENSGLSVAFSFTKAPSTTQWSASAPCAIDIP